MSDIVGNSTLRSVWDDLAARRGSRTFLEYFDQQGASCTYTYREFNELVNQAANLFLELGVKARECVALHLHSSPEFLMCLFGLAKIGAIAVPIGIHQKAEECRYVFERCGIEKVVTEPCFRACYGEGAALCPAGLVVVAGRGEGVEGGAVGGVSDGCREVEPGAAAREALREGDVDFAAGCERQVRALVERRPLSSGDLCEVLFTNGTTSCPKGVEITHANMVFSGIYGAWQFSLGADDRLLTTMPACHSNFQMSALTPVLAAGATLVFVQKYSARRFWRQVREHRATVIQMVAMIARTLMLQPHDAAERDHRVRLVQYYLNVTNEEKEEFERRFGVSLMNSYGLTESIGWALTDPPSGERRWPSVGRPGLGYVVDIVDDDGRELPAGEVGEIRIGGERGRTLMRGYFGDPKATARAFDAQGRLCTGDKGYRDEDGWFFFVDRKCNMLKRAGENISASEVEAVLEDHPAVREAAVIGVPDPIWDQAVKAFVALTPGATATPDDLKAYCDGRLADFKVPTIYEFVDALPRTSMGKVAKKLLK